MRVVHIFCCVFEVHVFDLFIEWQSVGDQLCSGQISVPQIGLQPARIALRVSTHPPEPRTATVKCESESIHWRIASFTVK